MKAIINLKLIRSNQIKLNQFFLSHFKKLMNLLGLVLIQFIFACGGHNSADVSVANENTPKKSGRIFLSEADSLKFITPTIYYIPEYNLLEQRCNRSDFRVMLTKSGVTIATVCKNIYNSCLMQGTCLLTYGYNKFLVNVGSKINGTYRFAKIKNDICRYGIGTQGKACLEPFYSIAADLNKFKLGDVIYIPDIAGTLLPDGQVHDGYFIVRDNGSAIKGYGRFDFFTGYMDYLNILNPFTKIGLSDMSTHLYYEKIDGVKAQVILRKHLYPRIP
jgi:3D (Asp-Asp-Asp) domain-containing protein